MRRNVLAVCMVTALLAGPVALAGGSQDNRAATDQTQAQTVAIIGDIPYGPEQIAAFPAEIKQINADPDVGGVIHLGDIKNGSSRCDTSYLEARLADFQSFADPLVYTPGDNEWTDCHRSNNGGFLPTERLDAIRRLFFPRPGRTLGQRKARVEYQSRRYPENTTVELGGVRYGVVHVVGSNDDQAPWFGDRKDATGKLVPETPTESALRAREYTAREAAALRWIDRIFDAAQDEGAPAVVVGMQADMWDGDAANQSAFAAIKAVLADRAARFAKPVLLLEGDSHQLKVDTPPGQPSNLTRIVVQGSTSVPHEWLRLHVDPSKPKVFSCENVVFGSGTVTPCPAPLA